MQVFDRWLTRAENLLATLGIIVLVLITGVVCFEIILRTFFARPQVWVIEFSEYGLLYITFLGTAWALRQGDHVRVDLLTNVLNAEWKRRLALVSQAVGFLVTIALTWFGVVATLEAQRRGLFKPTILEFPTWIVLLVIPVGSVMLVLRFLQRFIALWQRTLLPG